MKLVNKEKVFEKKDKKRENKLGYIINVLYEASNLFVRIQRIAQHGLITLTEVNVKKSGQISS